MYSRFYLSNCFFNKIRAAQFIQSPKKKMSISLLNQCSTSSVCVSGRRAEKIFVDVFRVELKSYNANQMLSPCSVVFCFSLIGATTTIKPTTYPLEISSRHNGIRRDYSRYCGTTLINPLVNRSLG